jgi:septal ring factor EnvC (AmiA/AmiB activator)
MQYTRILAVALLLTLGAGAALAQNADRPQRDGDRKAHARHDKGDHASRIGKAHKRLQELEAKLKKLKARQADGEARDPERLAEAIKRIEDRIAEIKAKLAAHREGNGEKAE